MMETPIQAAVNQSNAALSAATVDLSLRVVERKVVDVKFARCEPASPSFWRDKKTCSVCRVEVASKEAWNKHVTYKSHCHRVRVRSLLRTKEAFEPSRSLPNAPSLRQSDDRHGKQYVVEVQDQLGAFIFWACTLCCDAHADPSRLADHLSEKRHMANCLEEFQRSIDSASSRDQISGDELKQLSGNAVKPHISTLLVESSLAYEALKISPKRAPYRELPKLLHSSYEVQVFWCEICWRSMVLRKDAACFDSLWLLHLQTDEHARMKRDRPLRTFNQSTLSALSTDTLDLVGPETAGARRWESVGGSKRFVGGARYLGVEFLVRRCDHANLGLVCTLCARDFCLVGAVGHVTSERHVTRFMEFSLRDDAAALCALADARARSAEEARDWVLTSAAAADADGGLQGVVAAYDPDGVLRQTRRSADKPLPLDRPVTFAARPASRHALLPTPPRSDWTTAPEGPLALAWRQQELVERRRRLTVEAERAYLHLEYQWRSIDDDESALRAARRRLLTDVDAPPVKRRRQDEGVDANSSSISEVDGHSDKDVSSAPKHQVASAEEERESPEKSSDLPSVALSSRRLVESRCRQVRASRSPPPPSAEEASDGESVEEGLQRALARVRALRRRIERSALPRSPPPPISQQVSAPTAVPPLRLNDALLKAVCDDVANQSSHPD